MGYSFEVLNNLKRPEVKTGYDQSVTISVSRSRQSIYPKKWKMELKTFKLKVLYSFIIVLLYLAAIMNWI